MSYPTINRVVLFGRLTRDADLRTLPTGETACGLRVACNSRRRHPDGGFEEHPNYFDVDVLGPLGERLARHIHKGARVAIDGHLEWREWKNSFQERREAVSVVADTVQFLDAATGRRDRQPRLQLVGAGADEASLAF
jgi:single-strand DNA-binding protein